MSNIRWMTKESLQSPEFFPQNSWTVDLRTPKQTKWSKIMNIFKRKKKRYLNEWDTNSVSEQDYIDSKFKGLENQITLLIERILILETLHEIEHIFVNQQGGLRTPQGKYLPSKEARIWLKENNYEYMKAFKLHGELWIKRKFKSVKK